MNRILLVPVLLLIAATIVVQAEARPKTRYDETTQSCRILDKGQSDWDSGPYGEGSKVFREVCKSCHTKNNDKGATFLYNESKTSKGWNRVFAKRYPQCAKDGSWDKVTPDQLLTLNDYLYRFAQNSADVNDSC